MYRVVPLARQCRDFILMHLEELSISQLCLLPLSTRKELLWQLPVADICQLESTAFIQGLDMAAFWKYPWEGQSVSIPTWRPDRDIEDYMKEWESTEYTRAVLYGLVATSTIGPQCLVDDELFCFRSPHTEDGELDVITFLFSIRKLDQRGQCELVFPPRYAHHSKTHQDDLTMHEVIRHFGRGKNELPTVFSRIEMFDDVKLDHVHFLRNVSYLGLQGRPFEDKGLEFLKAVIREATHLEVLMLGGGLDEEEDCECLDEFCMFLSCHPTFLSNFRILKVLNSEYRVSRHCFNQLITSYFASPTDHVQKMEFSLIRIRCSDVAYEFGPKIDECYLSYKTIELNCCKFISEYEATPVAISHWLGRGIQQMKSAEEHGSCFFKVEKKISNPARARKRKHFELDLEDTESNG